MMRLPGYQIIEEIYESSISRVYRGYREQDNQPVILKLLNQEYPAPEAIARYKLEYEITRSLNIEGVIKAYSLEKYRNSLAIVLEDFGGKSLKMLSNRQKLNLSDFLTLAIQIVDILGEIHKQNIMHKDINPSNIVFNPETQQIKIIDFGISTVLCRENPALCNPNVLEGTLAYMSPEQTGRMNRSMDYRTDFYSLGTTFYELLTGQLPFDAADAMELVHCHIAKQPIPLHERTEGIPEAVSDIAMKLLAKTAEERYQSAYGLKADLQECLTQLQAVGNIDKFSLARQDISDKLQITQKLYGRELEVETLITAFDTVALGNSELMLVAGFSGIGKSALVNEVHKSIVRQRGYFISGKFDQFKRNIPLASLVQAFQDLIRQILTESEEQIAAWRAKLLEAFGANGQVMIDVIPEIELIIGQQPSVTECSTTEAFNRFNLVFQKLIRVFAQAEHPLVLFLDDLQWADLASLKLLQLLMTDSDTRYLLIIGAYRDNEVNPIHPLMMTTEEICKAGKTVNRIELEPLDVINLNHLIADTLNCSLERSQPLAELVMSKTQGNPFFSNQFLNFLYSDGLLKFNYSLQEWQWDISSIRDTNVSNNVVEFMTIKLQKLSQKTQNILKIAACIGNQFSLATLAIVYEKSLVETAADLWESLDEGLILPIGDDYKFVQANAEIGCLSQYKFLHDRVQQAAYSLISEADKQTTHLRIGQLLLENTPSAEVEEKIFVLVNQLNVAKDAIAYPTDGVQTSSINPPLLAKLNLIAGRKAKAATAYEPAVKYLTTGIELLNSIKDEPGWQNHYDLTLALYTEAAEASYLNTNFEQSERLAETILQQANTLLDRVKAREIKTQIYTAQNQPLKAIDTGLEALEMLGIGLFNPSDTPDGTLRERNFVVQLPSSDRLADFPTMADPNQLAAMRILVTISPAVYFSRPDILPNVILTMVMLGIEQGHCVQSTYAYATYGLFMCGAPGNMDTGYYAGQLAMQLLEQLNANSLRSKVGFQVNSFIRHWKEHARETIPSLRLAIQTGLEIGDLEHVGSCAAYACAHLFFIGEPLESLEQQQAQYINLQTKFRLEHNAYRTKIWRQIALNFLGRSTSVLQLSGECFDEAEMLPYFRQVNNRNALFNTYVAKEILSYSFKDYELAIQNALLAEEYSRAGLGAMVSAIHKFYYSLILLSHYSKAEPSEQEQYLKQVAANQEKMRLWAHYAPENYQHKYALVEAELARVLGNYLKAMDDYDLAIQAARKQEYIQEEGLSYELAAELYLALGRTEIAQTYMTQAHYCYICWGALSKVKDLEARYPRLILITSNSRQLEAKNEPNKSKITSTSGSNSSALDLTTVLKASQAISGEIFLDKLLGKLMKIMIENAGATKGYLILETKGKLLIEAEGAVNLERVTVLQSIPVDSCQLLPTAIVNYVARIQKSVVLNDASSEGRFTKDPYIKEHNLKSVLCTPLINQGKLAAILYLENNLIAGAFTPNRLEIINLLSSQTSISIENARLYKNMTELNQAYARFVPREFLECLAKESIIEVKLGDQIQKEMSVLFSDIRDFTTLSESMTPADNFKFINAYLSRMEPAINENKGFIDKYIGDAIMALFSNSADDAVKAGISMLQRLADYNQHRVQHGYIPIQIGIGINTGYLMLGTVGGHNRMDGTVISDAVNLASRIESLTKNYYVSLLITHHTFLRLQDSNQYGMRLIDQVKVKGKSENVSIFEVFDADLPEVREGKLLTKTTFEEGLVLFNMRNFSGAAQRFADCLRQNPSDRVSQIYLDRCR